MTAIDRTAREIGLALGDCGSAEASTLVEEIAVLLVELADEPPRRGRRRRMLQAPSPRFPGNPDPGTDS